MEMQRTQPAAAMSRIGTYPPPEAEINGAESGDEGGGWEERLWLDAEAQAAERIRHQPAARTHPERQRRERALGARANRSTSIRVLWRSWAHAISVGGP